MLTKIIQFSISNKLLIGLFTAILLVYGSFELRKLPIDAVPDITNNQVQVITVAPSFGAADIERLVTFPIEQANSNIPGLVELRSFSRFGLSLVTIVFDENTDVYWARQQVAERLQSVRQLIPPEIGTPELGPITTGLGEIYQYTVRPDKGYERKYNIRELRTLQDWIVRRQLLGVRGVAEVSSFGGELKQYVVELDPEKLMSFHLTIEEVFQALTNNNENTGGSYIEKGPGVLNIRTEGLLRSPSEIEAVVVRSTANGAPVLLRELARVTEGSATRFGALTYNGEMETAGGVVMMLKGANSSEVIHTVKNKIEEIKKMLPEGVIIEPFLDRTKMVDNAISTVEKNLLEGALIVVLVLVLFLGNFRAGLLVASVIPLSMLFAVIMMNIFGVSGNLMSLGALDFGLIVDGAVIIVEAVMHQLSGSFFPKQDRIKQEEMDRLVSGSAGRMMNSAVFGQLIILVVYLPIFSLHGIEGKMFKPMAQTVAFALAGAFLLSLTYIPMMSAVFLSKKIHKTATFSDRIMERLSRNFVRALEKILLIPKTVITTVLVLFLLAVWLLSRAGGEFIPQLEEGDFAVETRLLPGSNLKTTIQETNKAAKILKAKFPEVISVVTKIGSGEVPTDPMPMDAADLIVVLKDKAEWSSAKTFNELSEKMSEAVSEVPGLTFSFQYPVQMRFNELMTGAKQDIVCKIYGEDLDTLALYAGRLGKLVQEIDGAADLYVETVTGMPQILIEYDRSALAQYGLSVSTVNKTLNAAFAGQTAGMVYEGERRFDLLVRLAGSRRASLEDVQNLLIPTASGAQIPLSHCAKVEIKNGPNQIQREEAKRRIIVGFNARGRDVESLVNELKLKVERSIKFPPGYYPVYGGTFENLTAAKERLSIAVPVSLVLIFFLLYFAFHSLRQGLLIFTAIPLSAIGGIFALTARGMPFSISAGIGFIALFGVAVLNGIVLIAEFNRLKTLGEKSLREIVIKGTSLRLRPVLMTASVASLGFLPMALSNGAGAEVQRPLATVVIGGLLLATLLTIFVLPVLFVMVEKPKKPKLNVAILTFFVFGCMSSDYKAQNILSLQSAIDSALTNNLTLRQFELRKQQAKALIKQAADIPGTMIGVEYGQINSRYKDNRLLASQNFAFPTVYVRQKLFYNSQFQEAQINQRLQAAVVKRDVSVLYYDILLLGQKKRLLQKSDSLYSVFLQRARKRFTGGESNVLEKITAESQQGQIHSQLLQLESDLSILLLQFKTLLNCKVDCQPDFLSPAKNSLYPSADTTVLKQHPLFQLKRQQRITSDVALKVERSRLLPEISLGYSNMTMWGFGSDEVYYTGKSRFQSGQIGLGLPLFYGAQKARIKSAKLMSGDAELQSEIEYNSLRLQMNTYLARYNAAIRILAYYEDEALKNARLVSAAAEKQFIAGQINYLDYVVLVNQATALENDYYISLREYNEAIIQLNYLSNP